MRVSSRVKIPTSVGPAYIIGEGNIAITVFSGSSTPSSITAWCCAIRTGKGTSSCLVHPPKGCSNNTGFLNPLSTNFCRVSWGEGKRNKNFNFKESNGMVISFAYLTKTFYCYSSTCSNCVDRVEESLVFSQNFPDVALTSNVYSLQPPNM